MDIDEKTCVYRIRKTVLQMLRDRGYAVAGDLFEQSKEDFELHYSGMRDSQNMMVTSKVNQDGEEEQAEEEATKLLVFFVGKERLNKEDLNEIGLKCLDQKAGRCIIVLKGMTPIAQKDIESLEPLFIEPFHQSELFVNITEHELVPQHSILSRTDKESLLKRYRARENQLPKIQQHDPVARYYGARKGDVMKIVRNSETAGKYQTYRIVV